MVARSRDGDEADDASAAWPQPPASWLDADPRGIRRQAVPGGLDAVAGGAWAITSRPLYEGQLAFNQGEACRNLYVVHSGSFKTAILLSDGTWRVNGFCYPGDLMGLDGLGGGAHASTATALEDSTVCAMPVASLRSAALGNSRLHEQMYRLMARQIVQEDERRLLLGGTTALGRLSAFLCELSERMRVRGYSALEFNIHMSRDDIGSYLWLRLETISRSFSALRQQGVLEVDKRHIVILSLAELQGLRSATRANVAA